MKKVLLRDSGVLRITLPNSALEKSVGLSSLKEHGGIDVQMMPKETVQAIVDLKQKY